MIDFILRIFAYVIALLIVQFITNEFKKIKNKKLESLIQDKYSKQLDNYFDNYDNRTEVITNNDLPTL